MIDNLYELLKGIKAPQDLEDYHSFLSPLGLNTLTKQSESFQKLVNQFMEETQGNRRSDHRQKLREHWELILLNLSYAVFQRRWILVPLSKRAFMNDPKVKAMGLSYSSMQEVIKYLHNERLIKLKKGALYSEGAKRTRIFPEKKLEAKIWKYFLDVEQPIEPPYVAIKTDDYRWSDLINDPQFSHTDVDEMTQINEFLKDHQWACKGPVVLRYTGDALGGGRLFTPYQNLPDRRVRIRINTLIDNKRLCEVDFNANHLRLQLAVLANEDAGLGPYEEICDIAEIYDRDACKAFITVAMGADDRTKAANALRQQGMNTKTFEAFEAAALERYPKVSLFTGWTHQAQNLEGQILKDVMLKGVKENVVTLPVHDAVAVQRRHAKWAEEAMKEAWQFHAGVKFEPVLKVDKGD